MPAASPTLVMKKTTPMEMTPEVTRIVLPLDVDRRAVEPVARLVEVAHTDLAEIAGL